MHPLTHLTPPHTYPLRYDVKPRMETVMPEPVAGSDPKPAG
jgi:hypothetical protein